MQGWKEGGKGVLKPGRTSNVKGTVGKYACVWSTRQGCIVLPGVELSTH